VREVVVDLVRDRDPVTSNDNEKLEVVVGFLEKLRVKERDLN
jgi:hypothetical protein